MSDDFETARKLACQVEDPAGPSLPCGECAGCLALDRIEAEVERLRTQLAMPWQEQQDSDRVNELEAEVERLRAALERIYGVPTVAHAMAIARAALAKEEK